MKKIISILLSVTVIITFFAGCSAASDKKDNNKISVVATIFPPFDFARQIGKSKTDVKLLLPPGSESHTFEPTPADIITIQNADIFIYTGSENDTWIDSILQNIDVSKMSIIKLMDIVKTVNEEIVDGMESDGGDNELDEHVWTSIKNSAKIAKEISNTFCKIDSENKVFYKQNLNEYLNDLGELEFEFEQLVQNSKRKTIVFGDRFPFRYFADDYGLNYYAAFPGCSAESEPTPKTVAFLIDKVKTENIPVVFYIEFSSHKTADTIAEATGAKTMLFHSCHNVSAEDMKNGATYISLMRSNLDALKTALN